MLSLSDIESFFCNILQFPDWKKHLDKDKFEFLKEVVQRETYYCYFQNISLSAVAPEDRRTPTLKEIIQAGLSGKLGVCVNHNVFMTFLLRGIGFDTFTTSGSCMQSPEDNHAMCIIRFNETDLYLVDVGCALPIEEPISLNKLPYHGKCAGFRYEYRFCEETKKYQRLHLGGSFFKGLYDDNREILRYEFTLEPRDYLYFQKGLVEIFCNPKTSVCLKSPFIFRCISPDPTGEKNLDSNSNGRTYVLMWGASMVIYDEVNREVVNFASYEVMKPHILKYFPKLDREELDRSLAFFSGPDTDIFYGSVGDR